MIPLWMPSRRQWAVLALSFLARRPLVTAQGSSPASMPLQVESVVLYTCVASSNGTNGVNPTDAPYLVPGPSGTTNSGGIIYRTLSSTTTLSTTTYSDGAVGIFTEEVVERFSNGTITSTTSALGSTLVAPPPSTSYRTSTLSDGSTFVIAEELRDYFGPAGLLATSTVPIYTTTVPVSASTTSSNSMISLSSSVPSSSAASDSVPPSASSLSSSSPPGSASTSSSGPASSSPSGSATPSSSGSASSSSSGTVLSSSVGSISSSLAGSMTSSDITSSSSPGSTLSSLAVSDSSSGLASSDSSGSTSSSSADTVGSSGPTSSSSSVSALSSSSGSASSSSSSIDSPTSTSPSVTSSSSSSSPTSTSSSSPSSLAGSSTTPNAGNSISSSEASSSSLNPGSSFVSTVSTRGLNAQETAAGVLFVPAPTSGTTVSIISIEDAYYGTTWVAKKFYAVTTGGPTTLATDTAGTFIVNAPTPPPAGVNPYQLSSTVISTTLGDGTEKYTTALLYPTGTPATTVTQPIGTLIINPHTSSHTYTTVSTTGTSGALSVFGDDIYPTTGSGGAQTTSTRVLASYVPITAAAAPSSSSVISSSSMTIPVSPSMASSSVSSHSMVSSGSSSSTSSSVSSTSASVSSSSSSSSAASSSASSLSASFSSLSSSSVSSSASSSSSMSVSSPVSPSASSSSISSSSVSSSTTPSASPTTLGKYVYQGCWTDKDTANRALSGDSNTTTDMSNVKCANYCSNKGYAMFGTEAGKECYCGSSLANTSAPTDGSGCTYACVGNMTSTCGGQNRMSLYSTNGTNPAYAKYKKVGCFTNTNTVTLGLKILQSRSQSSPLNNGYACAAYCAAGGFLYFGTQAGTDCYCGNRLISASGDSAVNKPVVDGTCNATCAGDGNQACGGNGRLTLYTLNGPARQSLGQYAYTGCYTKDTASAPSWATSTIMGIGMSNYLCAKYCGDSSANTVFATSGQNCYCGANSSTAVVAVDARCTTPCPGDSTSTCGASDGLSLYTVYPDGNTTIFGYTNTGCYADEYPDRRVLNGPSFNSTDMSSQLCAAYCLTTLPYSYSYFGVENGNTCYCGSYVRGAEMGTCTSTCPNTNNQLCGGTTSLQVWKLRGTLDVGPVINRYEPANCYTDSPSGSMLSTAVYKSTNRTNVDCAAYCNGYMYFGTENGGDCYCSNGLGTGDYSDFSSCVTPCGGDSRQSCGGTNIMRIFGRRATHTPVHVGQYVSRGCYTDNDILNRAVSGTRLASDAMTLDICKTFCNGTTYFGVEFGRECYCGNTLSSTAAVATDGRCSMACSADDTTYCGGPNGINVYKSQAWHYVSLGCYTDSVASDRALSLYSYENDNMTIVSCQQFCHGAQYYGLEFGRECYCGGVLGSSATPNADNCNVACAGNSSAICGGSNRMNLFQYQNYTISAT